MTSEMEGRNAKRQTKRRRHLEVARAVSTGDIDWQMLAYALDQITKCGGALRVGCTRDGGAWAFGIYGDGPAPYTEYVRPDEDVNAYLQGLAQFFEGIAKS